MSKRRWVITGCNGYLGSELCKYLTFNGEAVLGVCRTGREVDCSENLSIPCICYEDLGENLQVGDILVHCAALVSNSGPWELFEKTNVGWPQELFAVAERAQCSHFIYISSIAALGYSNRQNTDTLTEEDAPNIQADEKYGKSKILAEQALVKLAQHSPMRLVILRSGLIYPGAARSGKQEVSWFRSRFWFLPDTICDHQQRIPLIHHENMCEAIYLAAQKSLSHHTFLLVDEEQPTRFDLDTLRLQLNLIKYRSWRILPSMIRFRHSMKNALTRNQETAETDKEMIEHRIRLGSRHLLYSSMRFREETGWCPRVTVTEGYRRKKNGPSIKWLRVTPPRIGMAILEKEPPTSVVLEAAVTNAKTYGVIARVDSAKELLVAQRRFHFDAWILDSAFCKKYALELRDMVWGCRDVIVLTVDGKLPLELHPMAVVPSGLRPFTWIHND